MGKRSQQDNRPEMETHKRAPGESRGGAGEAVCSMCEAGADRWSRLSKEPLLLK